MQTAIDIFKNRPRPTRYKLIGCEVFYRECCFAAAVSRNVIDLEFLTQGLHDLENTSMSARIQQAVDAASPERFEAVLLGYALCNNGLVGVQARELPLVLPRAHDCITMFMGSKEEYARYFKENKGTFFLTTGWVERDSDNMEDTAGEDNFLQQMGLDMSFEQYKELYGESAAQMIMDTIGRMNHYGGLCHIDMGIAPDAERTVAEAADAEAENRGWSVDRKRGKMDLFLELAAGGWDEEKFLVVPPGHVIKPSYDEMIVKAVPAQAEEQAPAGR